MLPNQVSEKSFYTFKNIDLPESHAKLHKKPSDLWEQIEFFAQCSLAEMKNTFIKYHYIFIISQL